MEIIRNLISAINIKQVVKTVSGTIDKKRKVKAISLMGGGGVVILMAIELFYKAIELDSSIAFYSGVITFLGGVVMAIMLGGIIRDVGGDDVAE